MLLDRGTRPAYTALAALAALALACCVFDDRTAGTSTTVTNPSPTVYGAAIFLDGSPAAGARVELRTTEYELGPGGAPRARLFAADTADGQGRFVLPRPEKMKEHYLIFGEIPQEGGSVPPDSIELQLRHWPDGLPPDGGDLATFRLGLPGNLTGIVEMGDTSADSTRWIGARGTDNFARVAQDGSFRLDRLAPGFHYLSLVTVPVNPADPGASKPFSVRQVAGADTVKSGQTRDMGILRESGD